MNLILNAVATLGRAAIVSCRATGALAIFAATGLLHLLLPPFYPRLLGRALIGMGFLSLPVVSLTAIFAGNGHRPPILYRLRPLLGAVADRDHRGCSPSPASWGRCSPL